MARALRQPTHTAVAGSLHGLDWRKLAICCALVAAVFVVFCQTVGFEFIAYDDDRYVYQNPHISPGLTVSGLGYAVTDALEGEYYPLTSLSHMLDCQFYGLSPGGHHLTNVLLHAASSVLLFLVLLRMTGDLWPSAWVAAIFAVHPLHVSSVAWVAERRELLAGLFFMLTLGAYTLYAERPSLPRYLAVVGCFALGLMSKPIVVTIPCLLLLLDYWPLDRFARPSGRRQQTASDSWLGRWSTGWRLAVEKIPLLALSAVSCGITMWTHKSNPVVGDTDPLSLTTRVANAIVSCAAYVCQTFYPVSLSPYYPHLGTHLPTASVVESLLLLTAITAVAAFFWRRLPYLLVGWLWFLAVLVPVLGLVGIFLQSRADNYTYLSQIGLSIALAWGVWSFYQSRRSRHSARMPGWPLGGVAGVVLLLLAAVAWRQTSYWRNDETVWTRTVSCTDQNALGHYSLANVLFRQKRTEEAITHLRQAVASYSRSRFVTAAAHCNLAELLTARGKSPRPSSTMNRRCALSPTNEVAHTGFAIALAARANSTEPSPSSVRPCG